jgi:ribose transport system substrate-binding protein
MRKVTAVFLAAAMAVTGLVGCSSKTTGGAAATTVAETTSAAAPEKSEGAKTEAKTDEKADGKTIYVIVKVLGNQYWSVLQAGAEQAGRELGCNVVVVGTALESDIEGQLTLLQNAVSAQADGIVIAPLDSVSLDAPITEANNSGIPVVLVDTVIKSDNYSAALLTNNVEAGKTEAE